MTTETLRLHRTVPRAELRALALTVWKLANRGYCRLMGGHWPLLHAERDRLSLKCAACGHTSPGWAVGRGHARQH